MVTRPERRQVHGPPGPGQVSCRSSRAQRPHEVFEMTGTLQNPVITPRNSMGFSNHPGGITSPPTSVAPRWDDADVNGRAVRRAVKRPN